ncbi:hypothetical protein [Pseudotabrizicola alkalilacus]|uniref:Uncharacterized protein n=1 Tax=Pseudotabrizicola alkalilacus TaxID=2305252 RepID=A0A411Z4G0_9RHOB|nr:hypothetical protein [Pseudotabrizicola alkalilacus]RGP37930.1 hypothetical protein D1012_08580 [Pseudotabrizicola alkalilacus]
MNSVVVRMILYVLSPLIPPLLALIPGWGISYAGGVVSIDLETLIAAFVAGLGISGAVFARWGVK